MLSNLINKLRILVVVIVCASNGNAQNINKQLKLYVVDNDSVALQGVDIIINNEKYSKTNENGISELRLPIGKYNVSLSHIAFEEQHFTLQLDRDKTIKSVLFSKEIALQEVIFTAREDKGLTSKSIIDRKAMEHLQPSSFSDLMELLPGGLAKTPNLTSTNVALLRENSGRPSTGGYYNTSSLGIQFMVDDNIINSNSDMQRSLNQNAMNNAGSYRNTISTGIDMRSISTNDIEKVKIIRLWRFNIRINQNRT